MNYQNYEDYMRQVLGYSSNDPIIYEPYDYRNYDIDSDNELLKGRILAIKNGYEVE